MNVINPVSVIIAPMVMAYTKPTGTALYVYAAAMIVDLGLLTWVILRSKAPTPALARITSSMPAARARRPAARKTPARRK
jgi:hypothetical protein